MSKKLPDKQNTSSQSKLKTADNEDTDLHEEFPPIVQDYERSYSFDSVVTDYELQYEDDDVKKPVLESNVKQSNDKTMLTATKNEPKAKDTIQKKSK